MTYTAVEGSAIKISTLCSLAHDMESMLLNANLCDFLCFVDRIL